MDLELNEADFPALYRNADNAAVQRQSSYYKILLFQYVILAFAATTPVLENYLDYKISLALYLIAILIASITLLFSNLKKPEVEWYKARALAESIKTLTWRYMMATTPFDDSKTPRDAALEFARVISELTRYNPSYQEVLTHGLKNDDRRQITDKMEIFRNSSTSEKMKYYVKFRIEDQLGWYQRNAQKNRRLADMLGFMSIFTYAFAALSAIIELSGVAYGSKLFAEPLLVVAAGLLGWTQAKRYSELAASYNLTAHEVTQIRDAARHQLDESIFLEFVVDSETAFSREHTQWSARKLSTV